MLRSSDRSEVPVRPAPESMMMVVSLDCIAFSGTEVKKSSLTSSTSLSLDGDSSVGYSSLSFLPITGSQWLREFNNHRRWTWSSDWREQQVGFAFIIGCFVVAFRVSRALNR